jgi:4-hydroxy-tetrahydrodipicolinate synthase
MIALGAEGVTSVVANAYPKGFSDMIRLCLQGKFTEAGQLHYRYIDIIQSMFAEGSPSGVKAYLSELGLCQNTFRSPVWPVSDLHHKKIRELMQGESKF